MHHDWELSQLLGCRYLLRVSRRSDDTDSWYSTCHAFQENAQLKRSSRSVDDLLAWRSRCASAQLGENSDRWTLSGASDLGELVDISWEWTNTALAFRRISWKLCKGTSRRWILLNPQEWKPFAVTRWWTSTIVCLSMHEFRNKILTINLMRVSWTCFLGEINSW